MRLGDILEIINDSACVIVYDANGDEVDRYDGKESISDALNECEVLDMYPYTDEKGTWLVVCIDEAAIKLNGETYFY